MSDTAKLLKVLTDAPSVELGSSSSRMGVYPKSQPPREPMLLLMKNSFHDLKPVAVANDSPWLEEGRIGPQQDRW